MRVLYAIQGTGNGHISRARDIVPILQKHCDLDLLISGTESEVSLPYPVKYRYTGFSFLYNRRGGVHYSRTFFKKFKPRLLREIRTCPVQDYDLVINDFEPVSAWASKFRGVPIIGMSHQAAYLSPHSPRPEKVNWFGEQVLKYYAPVSRAIGFHFESYDDFIYPPVIRSQIREAGPQDSGHYTVYLPAVEESELLAVLAEIPQVDWQVFSKYAKAPATRGNVTIFPVDNKRFVESFIHCTGILTGAGFETPAEAMWMGKKLFCIPIRGQYEQHCNYASLQKLGVSGTHRFSTKITTQLREWVDHGETIRVDWPQQTEAIILKALGKTQPERVTVATN